MSTETVVITGVAGGIGAKVANWLWRWWPGHEQFTVERKSPLSFIEHYHIGLGLTMTGNPILMGAGAVLVADELFQDKPFGAGKTPNEIAGNLILTSTMVGLASVDFDEIRKRFRKETAKLDRWIYQKDIREYLKEEKK